MQASDFPVGSFVRWRDDPWVPKGTVIGNKLSDGDRYIAVEWADGALEKVNVKDIKPYDSDLEEAYNEMRELLKVAASKLHEANEIARSQQTTLSDLNYAHIGVEDILHEMNAAGWITSSMNC